jgi:hypothetical protein
MNDTTGRNVFQFLDVTIIIYGKIILYFQFYVLFFLGALGVLGG